MTAYYNEHDEFAADWLRNLIKAGLIADGEVDTRSIVDVRSDDLRGFAQCHFFAGIGGWSYALRKAGWNDNRPAWTGSCPCQPFSLAGAQRGFADERHLWPTFRGLIEECGPAIVFGEQVASATEWLGLVRGDLEKMGYAVGCFPIQAASAGADHLRDRYWFVADADHAGLQGRGLLPERAGKRIAGPNGVADATGERGHRGEGAAGASRWDGVEIHGGVDLADASRGRRSGQSQGQSEQPGRAEAERPGDLDWVIGADGKARRVPKPNICGMVDGLSEFLGRGGSVDEILRAMWPFIVGNDGFAPAALLFAAVLRQIEDCDGGIAEYWTQACSEAFRGKGVSGLWIDAQSRTASYRRKPVKQPIGKRRGALQNMPRGYARCSWDVGFWGATDEFLQGLWLDLQSQRSSLAREDLLSRMPERMGTPLCSETLAKRVGLLRGFGNAIDYRPAKEFIQAFMTTRPSAALTSQDRA